PLTLLNCYDAPLSLPSFPTRRSSDLEQVLGTDHQAGPEELHQGDREGHPEGHVQDGHLDLPVLLRCPDLRRGRPVERVRRQVLRSEEHTSELQSRENLVCRLLLEKKK